MSIRDKKINSTPVNVWVDVADESAKLELTRKFFDLEVFQYAIHIARLWHNEVPDRPNHIWFNHLNEQWRNSYNALRGQEWPDCDDPSMFDTLPIFIQDECRNVHKFSPETWTNANISFDDWVPDKSWFPPDSIVKRINLLFKDTKYFEDKVVVDLACNAGHIGLAALHNGAKLVRAFDVRDYFVNVAKKAASLLGYAEKFEASVADVHDYDNLSKICNGADTVMICQLMYHVHDHCKILETIVESRPMHIIIEQVEDTRIFEMDIPLISWLNEPTLFECNGWYQQKQQVMVGYPNVAWFKHTMEYHGYRQVECNFYYEDDEKLTSSIQVYERV
jgi:2-polyprenyl-3-methyl-5-hydroxy-6-metoxy-1,4-benzoquinol methylase